MSSLVVETSPVSWAWPYLQLYDHHANFNRKNMSALFSSTEAETVVTCITVTVGLKNLRATWKYLNRVWSYTHVRWTKEIFKDDMYILYFIDILSHGLKSHLGTYRIKVQEKSPVFFLSSVLKKNCFDFQMYCTVFVTVFVTREKFYGMNNILLLRLKSSTLLKFSQLKSRIWTSNLECFFYIRTYFSLSGWIGSYLFVYQHAKF